MGFWQCTDDQKSAAVEAVLLLQGKINDEDAETVEICLLVPSKIIGCLIGKSGSIVNEMRKTSKAVIRISKGEKPKYSGSDDELVEVSVLLPLEPSYLLFFHGFYFWLTIGGHSPQVQGNAGSVRDALVQIVLRLRDAALKEREDGGQSAPPVDSLYSSGHAVPSVMPSVPNVAPPAPPFGSEPRMDAVGGVGMLSGGAMYGYGSLQVVPSCGKLHISMCAYMLSCHV